MVLFLLAVVAITATVNLAVALLWLTSIGRGIAPYRVDAAGNVLLAAAHVPAAVYVWTTLVTLTLVAGRSLVAVAQLRAGGDAVARMVGGVPVDRATTAPDERRLLNIVDEMAIASGVAVPRVYVLPDEPGVNAFAAGDAPNQAAIAVTAGALRRLTRDELQAVVGHEFSHVLNGDMRLNLRMIGVLAGILFLGEIGQFLLRASGRRRGRGHGRGGLVLLGLVLTVIGYVGLFFGRLLRAAVSRQREHLADASSIQFTRNPDGLAGALAVIGSLDEGSLVRHRHAETLGHMFFAEGIRLWLQSVFATHPPLPERIAQIAPRFVVADYLRRRARALDGAAPDAAAVAPGSARRQTSAAASPSTHPAAAVVASVGRPAPAHVEHATRVLAAVPAVVRDAANDRAAAPALLVALALAPDEAARKEQLAILERRDAARAQQAGRLADPARALPPPLRLPVVELALASLRPLDQPARDAVVADLLGITQAEPRASLETLVLVTLARQQLAGRAARAAPVKHRSILEVADDARLVLSLLAHAGVAGGGGAPAALGRGLVALRLPATPPVPLEKIGVSRVGAALDRLRQLAPFVKRELLEACADTVTADAHIAPAEAELLRAVATTLDCPVPPLLEGGAAEATVP